MEIKISEGDFAHMGVYQEKESIVFTFEAEKNDTCSIVLISEKDCKNIKIDGRIHKSRVNVAENLLKL